jgi:DNA-directed RNA polymerase subunit beta
VKGHKLLADLVDAKQARFCRSGQQTHAAQTAKMTEQGVKEILVQDEALVGRYLATDIIDENTGEVLFEAGDEITAESLEKLQEVGIKELPTLGIDHVNVGPYIRNTLQADKNATREEALIDIYRVMRPGEPPTLESAEALFQGCSSNSTATTCPRWAA